MRVAKLCGAAIVLFILAAPAYADTLTLDITGTGSGNFDGTTTFTNQTFDFHLAGPSGGGNVVNLSIANAAIGGGSPVDFTSAMHIGLHFTPDYAFFGYAPAGSDVLQLIFSSSDFALLQNSNSFSGAPTSVVNSFLNVPTSGGLLTFSSFSDVNLSFVSTPSETPLPAALPLFAGGLGVIGLLARRRNRKNLATVAA